VNKSGTRQKIGFSVWGVVENLERDLSWEENKK
jgi:hypothetical protein